MPGPARDSPPVWPDSRKFRLRPGLSLRNAIHTLAAIQRCAHNNAPRGVRMVRAVRDIFRRMLRRRSTVFPGETALSGQRPQADKQTNAHRCSLGAIINHLAKQ